MEFLDEDARPRFVLQSKPLPSTAAAAAAATPTANNFSISSLHKPTLFISLSLSILIFTFSIFYFTFEPFQSLFLWLSLSLLLGPFAPLSLTAGDIRVGVGPPIKTPPPNPENESINNNRKPNKKSSKIHQKVESFGVGSVVGGVIEPKKDNGLPAKIEGGDVVKEEGEWSEGDVELLKKLMGKHPVGKPGRWEAITEGLKGKYKVESVIKMSKEMGEKKLSDEDSYKRFLKDRKPVDKRSESEDVNECGNGVVGNGEVKGESGSGWTAGEDLALLNALKTFPKEVAMRWEKIAAAVPGKTKAACMKRVTVLKKDFRSSKAASGEA